MAYGFNEDKSKYDFDLDLKTVSVQPSNKFSTESVLNIYKSGNVVTINAELETKSRTGLPVGDTSIATIPQDFVPTYWPHVVASGASDGDPTKEPKCEVVLKNGSLSVYVRPVTGSYHDIDHLSFTLTYILG